MRTGDGASKVDYVVWGSYYNRSHTQQIYTADELTAAGLSAGYISKVAFQYAWTTSYTKTVTIYMGLTEDNAFASTDFATLSAVSAPLEIAFSEQDQWYEIELADPFYWDGISNVIVGALSVGTNYPSNGTTCFYGGTTSDYRALYSRADSSNPSMTTGMQTKNRADIRFTMCPQAQPCPVVGDLSHELLEEGTTKARISWAASNADYLSGYEIIRSENPITDFSEVTGAALAANVTSVEYSDLAAGTHYYIYVRAICKGENHDDGESGWASIDFTTNADCPLVTNLSAALTALNAVSVTWEKAFAEQEPHFQYILSTSPLDDVAIAAASPVAVDDATGVEIPGLLFAQEYHIYVASVCGAAHSDYVHASFTTLPSCQPVTGLTAVRTQHNLIELSWASADFATETQWEVGIVGQEGQIVSERKAILFGLTPATAYQVYVKAKCSSTDISDAAVLDVTTAPQPGSCQQIGEGTSAEYGPVCAYYGYERNGYIFTAEDGLKTSGKIESLSWYGSTAKTVPVQIYLKNTTETDFNTSMVWN